MATESDIIQDALPHDQLIARFSAPANQALPLWDLPQGGVVTPGTIAGKNGEIIQEYGIDGLPNNRYLVMFKFVEGTEPDEITARTHIHSLAWQRPENFERLVWNTDTVFAANPTWGDWHNVPRMTAEKQRIMQRLEDTIVDRLQRFGKSTGRYGLIHADMRLANLLVH